MYLALLTPLIFFFKLIVMLPLRAGGLSHYPAGGRLMSRHETTEEMLVTSPRSLTLVTKCMNPWHARELFQNLKYYYNDKSRRTKQRSTPNLKIRNSSIHRHIESKAREIKLILH